MPARRRRARRLTVLLATAAAAVTALAACGTTEDDGADATTGTSGGAATSAASGPITVTDARGKKITFDKPPTRAVALEWGLIEQVVSVGVQPVGISDVKGYKAWVHAATVATSVKDVGQRGEPSTDTIGGLDPDVIFQTEDATAATNKQLERVAPVVVVKNNDPKDPVGQLRKNIALIGKVLGRDAAATQVTAKLDGAIAAAKQKLAAADLANTPVAISDGYREASAVSLRMYTPTSTWGGLAKAIGLQNQWTTGGDPSYGLAQTDVEGLTKIKNTGTRFLYLQNKADGGDVYTDVLAKNAVWKGLPFVKADHVSRLPDGTWPFGGPLSGVQFVERVTDILTEQS
ncbi:ABC transporter substrate-binding protein [Jatrophihabitans endophyticus]|nr:iron-siderophore ABC transporter substrate-binding protein [Jatrophihabitans endophyticus]